MSLTNEQLIDRALCEQEHLHFTRYFFRKRQNLKWKVNWHHVYLSELLEKIFTGEVKNLVINVPPGSGKTELAVINFIARGLALNPWARFLHISYSDDLALLNSTSARELVESDEYQELWPLSISADSKAKKRWNVELNGKKAGGVYAVALGGSITGFRAGHMAEGFQGAIIIDDPQKAGDSFSSAKIKASNLQLTSNVLSRKASPDTPVIVIMQRLGVNDTTGYIQKGGFFKEYLHIVIPAIIDDAFVATLPPHIQKLVKSDIRDKDGRFSYWEEKEPLADLLDREAGMAEDKDGNLVGKHVFSSQYMNRPILQGGNIIKSSWFKRWSVLPRILHRSIYVDTAMKTATHNDFSVLQCWGLGEDKNLYLLDQIRGKWEAPELKNKAKDFWEKHRAIQGLGMLRHMIVEEKAAGTGLVQDLKTKERIPVKGIERNTDKLTRVMDVLSYIEIGRVRIPETASWISDFTIECEQFTAEDTHDHDDQIDPMCDAIVDKLVKQRGSLFY